MKKQEAVRRIVEILKKEFEHDVEILEFVSQKIYADVVATAVDDERNLWTILCARNPELDC